MSCCGNCCAPLNNGVANITECSVLVACFCASCCFIFNCFCGMSMSAVPSLIICLSLRCGNHILCHLIHFSINLRTFARERIFCAVCKCNDTEVYIHADINRPKFFHILKLSIRIRRFTILRTACISITHFEFPCTDRKRSKNAFAGLVI